MNDRITIFVTKEEAALFILFQKNYHSIGFMMAEGVFDIHKGNAILSFDEKGQLKSIKRELFSYLSPVPLS